MNNYLLGIKDTENEMDYLKLLEHSYSRTKYYDSCCETRLEFLCNYIFDITTHYGEMDELFATRAVEVCAALSNRSTFDYISVRERHIWYLTMCNLPFFSDRIEWGTSIRGAWWSIYGVGKTTTVDSCGLWDGEKQITELELGETEWPEFIAAVLEFAQPGVKPNAELRRAE